MTTTQSKSEIELLAEKYEAAQAEFAAAQAAMKAEQEAAELRRQTAYADHDRQIVAGYDAAADDREVAAAEQALREAVLADPVWTATARLYAASLARFRAHDRRNQAVIRLKRAEAERLLAEYLVELGEIDEPTEAQQKEIKQLTHRDSEQRADYLARLMAAMPDEHYRAPAESIHEPAARLAAGTPAGVETILRIVGQVGANQAEDVSDEWEQARMDAGETAARQRKA